MDLLINFLSQLIIYTVFLTTIYGYGFLGHNIIFGRANNSVGEIGIFGFIISYLIVLILHFVIPINTYVSCVYILIGFYFGIKKLKLKIFNNKYNYIVLLIFFYTALLTFTINLHDDAYWYHLPTINYYQKFKIIFGVVNINHFIYGQGFYAIMSLFQVPIYENSFVYLLPVVFLFFFLIYLNEIYKVNKNNKIYYFLINIIILLILLRYTRSKEFGSDLAAQILIFLVFINILQYLIYKKKDYYYKALIFFTFGIFIKLYVAILLPIIIFAIIKLKKDFFDIFKQTKLLFFLVFLMLISFTKNYIQSGCAIYPISITCFDKTTLQWSPGKNYIKRNLNGIKAYAKGYNAYTKNTKDVKKYNPKEFLENHKYNYGKFLIKDKDFERFLISIFIFFFVYVASYLLRDKKRNIKKNSQYLLVFFTSLMILSWYSIGPSTRYGGNAFIYIFFFSILYSLDLINRIKQKKIFNYFLLIALSFSVLKNTDRIKNEYENSNYSQKFKFPIINFEEKKYSIKNKFILPINVTKHPIYCYNIKMLCTTENIYESIFSINNINGYLFIESDEKLKIFSTNEELKYVTNKYFSK